MSSPPRFGLLVPVKAPAVAKSRLAPLGHDARVELARAFALDTVSAALATPAVGCVLAVTDDHLLAAALHEAGAGVLPDGVAGDLNGTLQQAAAELGRRFPELRPAALCADLPALRPEDLDAALRAVPPSTSALVPDADGVGTTLLVAAAGETLRPAFGTGSREAHRACGAVELDGALSLRRDVDTPADLDVALALGVGPCTSLAVTLLGLTGTPRL